MVLELVYRCFIAFQRMTQKKGNLNLLFQDNKEPQLHEVAMRQRRYWKEVAFIKPTPQQLGRERQNSFSAKDSPAWCWQLFGPLSSISYTRALFFFFNKLGLQNPSRIFLIEMQVNKTKKYSGFYDRCEKQIIFQVCDTTDSITESDAALILYCVHSSLLVLME